MTPGRALRVGLHLGQPVPSVGGNFTMTSEVLRALAALRGETHHALETFGWFDAAGWYRPGEPTLHHVQARTLSRRLRRLEARLRRRTTAALGVGDDDPVLESLVQERRYDLVWCMAHAAVPTFEAPFVTMVYDIQHRRQPFFPEVSAAGEWDRREDAFRSILPRATAVVTGTAVGAEELVRFYGVAEERILRLPHPTPGFALEPGAPTSDAAVLERHGLAPDGYILYPAQLWAHKNHVGLLRAARVLEDEHGHAPVIALSGSDAGNGAHVRAEVARLGLSHRVRLLGFVPQADLAALYRGALCLCYLTWFGPENLPPLEAFALGCPVVASRVAGAEEQLGDAALLVDPGAPAEVAQALRRVLVEPDLRRALVERGRRRASAWTSLDFARGVLAFVDRFEARRACWD